jgi:peptidoglycan/LPS O-acetylase OafA/YrhL
VKEFSGNLRRYDLDLLRFFAVVLVLGRHFMHSPQDDTFLCSLLEYWKKIGWVGVDLFFVLSGFLIHSLLRRELQKYQSIWPGLFLARRAFKLYPAFYVLIGITVLLDFEPDKLLELMGELLFIQNYTGGLWNHTWTLAIEEHFYLLWSFLFALAVRLNVRKIIPFLLVPLIVIPLFRIYTVCSLGHAWDGDLADALLTATHYRIDGLLWGVLLAELWYHHSSLLRQWKLCIGAGTLILMIVSSACLSVFDIDRDYYLHTFGFSLLSITFSGLLLSCLVFPGFNAILSKGPLSGLCRLGSYSYSIYLWHMFVYQFSYLVGQRLLWSAYSHLAVYFVGSFVVGVVMSKCVEAPVLNLRDRALPSRAKIELA